MEEYTLYVRCIRQSLKGKVSPEDLRSDLLAMPATDYSVQELSLLSDHKAELEKAVTINAIFDFLIDKCVSFLNYDIFQFMVKTYSIDHGQEELKYPELLKDYLEEHRVSDYLEIKARSDYPRKSCSKKLVLKMDIHLTSKLSRINDLRTAIAEVWGMKPAALEILDIGDGCVMVTFLIPTPVANVIFNSHTILTRQRKKKIQALAVLSLECNGCKFSISPSAEDTM